jgi:small-conductance mechanosensitive channel
LGIIFGALTAGLGFALQKPISSVAAWVMMVVKRPFDIGDRVIIGDVKGNVREITLTHIYLEEVGRYGGEELSGRIIIIPNSQLFEKNIINYSLQNDITLGQVIVTVAYESNLDHGIEISVAAAEKFAAEYNKASGKSSHVRLYFVPNGIEIHIRYYVPFDKAQEIATNITKEIYTEMKIADDIEMSYPHTKIIVDKKFSDL